VLSVSALTGDGIPELFAAISTELSGRVVNAGTATRLRHRNAMVRALESLDAAKISLQQGGPPVDIVAEDLRVAMRALDSLIGKVDVEDLLGEIFSSFCIGK
jgi:tRNA modification GTPase